MINNDDDDGKDDDNDDDIDDGSASMIPINIYLPKKFIYTDKERAGERREREWEINILFALWIYSLM